MEELVQRLGFTDEKEFHRMVASVDLTTPEKREAFHSWKENDGSKDGLLKLSKMVLQSGSSDLLLEVHTHYVKPQQTRSCFFCELEAARKKS